MTHSSTRQGARKRTKYKEALQELLAAVTSKGSPDSAIPICWSGSPDQNRRMYAAIDRAREALMGERPPGKGEGR